MIESCWVIAGATSTIASAFAHEVAKKGDQLILLGRNDEKMLALKADLHLRYPEVILDCLHFDAIETDSHESIAKECAKLAKTSMNLLIAFGFMLRKTSIEHSVLEAVTTVNANYTGAVSLCFSFKSFFHKDRSRVLVLGSVAGERGRASNFVYGSAKAALATFCEGLRAVLHSKNIGVTLMKLGYIDTPMTYGMPDVFLVATPEKCARACLKAANARASIRYFPWFWRWIILVYKNIPSWLLRRLKV